jgi:HD-GYP domain-containing protein (c-di-GMP phosphodiesterase class II)
MMGLAFVNHLNWSPFKIKEFGLGGLLHDIGMTEIPQNLLNKATPLTPDERHQIERHPNNSARILKGLNCLGMQSMLMVQQHHENGDGSGYPQGLKLAEINPWAQILRIIDSYEAVTSPRPWRPALTPLEALLKMCGEWKQGKIYDPGYLDAFVKFITKK